MLHTAAERQEKYLVSISLPVPAEQIDNMSKHHYHNTTESVYHMSIVYVVCCALIDPSSIITLITSCRVRCGIVLSNVAVYACLRLERRTSVKFFSV